MKILLAICLTGLSFPGFAIDESPTGDTWLRERITKQLGKFERTSFVPHPGDAGILAVCCETSLSWWGSVYVLHHTADQVDWVASFPKEYTENHGHYILSSQWRRLERLNLWVLEIFDSTHMGNGSLWLFTLAGHDLRLLLHATARGRHLQPPADFKVSPLTEIQLIEPHLEADYRTLGNATTDVESVFLTGTLAVQNQDDKELSRIPYAEIWTWDAERRIFTRTPPED